MGAEAEEEMELELVEAVGAEEAEEAGETDVVVLDAEEVVQEEAEEAGDVQTAVVEMVDVVQVMEHEDVVDEGGRLEGRTKRRRHM